MKPGLHQLAPSGAADGQAPVFDVTSGLWLPADVVRELVEGTNITIDNTDPQRPVISTTGGADGSVPVILLPAGSDATDVPAGTPVGTVIVVKA